MSSERTVRSCGDVLVLVLCIRARAGVNCARKIYWPQETQRHEGRVQWCGPTFGGPLVWDSQRRAAHMPLLGPWESIGAMQSASLLSLGVVLLEVHGKRACTAVDFDQVAYAS